MGAANSRDGLAAAGARLLQPPSRPVQRANSATVDDLQAEILAANQMYGLESPATLLKGWH